MESGTGTGGGLMWAVGAIFLLIVLAVFSGRGFGRDGGYDGGHGGYAPAPGYGYGGYGGDGCCGVKGCRPAFYDESNYEEEKHLQEKLCKVDHDVHEEGEETRDLINNNTIQALRDKLVEKDMKIQTLEFKGYVDANQAATNAQLAAIQCKMLDKPNVYPYSYIECQPNPCGNRDRGERRKRCDDEWDIAG